MRKINKYLLKFNVSIGFFILFFTLVTLQVFAQLQNTLYGIQAGNSITSGSYNTFVGYQTGYSTTTGGNNSFYGRQAGYNNTTGNFNSFFGKDAGFSNTSNGENSFFGNSSGYNSTGYYNSFFGSYSGYSNTSGNANSFFGLGSGRSNTTGDYNSFFGLNAGYSNTDGDRNTFIGMDAGYSNSGGKGNVFIGYQAGYSETGDEMLHIANVFSKSLIKGSFANDWVVINGKFGLLETGTSPQYYTYLQSGDIGSDITYTLPTSGGTNGYILTTSGGTNPILSWTPGGNITKVGSMNSGDVFADGNADGQWLGLGTNDGRIQFNLLAADDEILLLDANVGIGSTNPTSKLQVEYTSDDFDVIAVKGISSGIDCSNNGSIGIYGEAYENIITVGVFGQAFSCDGNLSSYGVQGQATNDNGSDNVGGYFTGTNKGVYAEATGTSGTDYGLYSISGGTYSIFCEGDAFANSGTWQTSDSKFKRDIRSFSNSLEIIKDLKPKTFFFRTEEYPYNKFSDGITYGFIAQELESILPGLVKESVYPEIKDKEGNILRQKIEFKAVNYEQLIPILTQGIKEQQQEIEQQKTEIEELRKEITELKEYISNAMPAIYNSDITSKEKISNTSVLFQNNPNPFSNTSSIEFIIAENFNNAYISITDLQGLQLQKHEIFESGKGSVIIKSNSFKAGIYLYSLIIDNKVIDTRKMIIN